MRFYDEQVLPRLIDRVMNDAELARIRSRVTAGLSGEVLEIGFGSGLNLAHYPAAVTRVLAVDPALVGRKLAARRVAAATARVDFIGLDGQRLPVESGSVDHVLSTWTLCTIPDLDLALTEIRRVLRPGGTLRFAEHGLSPDAKVARWQHRLTPWQRRFVGGCHLDRPIARLLADAGLEVTELDNYYTKGPKALGYSYEGVATAG